MKLNLVNKIYIAIAVLLLIGIVWRVWRYKPWDRYYFFASVNAPLTFPIYIRDIYFTYPGGDDSGEGFYYSRDEVNNFTSNWGNEYFSPSINKSLRLPKALIFQYVSYRDAKFYRDTLNLPQQELRDSFKEASQKNQLLSFSPEAIPNEKRGLHFVVGIANEGNLIVWLRGVYYEKVLLKTKLKAKVPQPQDLYYRKPLSRKEYFEQVFKYMPDSLKQLIGQGVDSKASYIDSPTHYIEKNRDLWEYQKKNN